MTLNNSELVSTFFFQPLLVHCFGFTPQLSCHLLHFFSSSMQLCLLMALMNLSATCQGGVPRKCAEPGQLSLCKKLKISAAFEVAEK